MLKIYPFPEMKPTYTSRQTGGEQSRKKQDKKNHGKENEKTGKLPSSENPERRYKKES